VYDVGRGTYDLRVGIGDDPPLVTRRDQPNAPASPGSGVGIFSFIGDLRDRSSVRYYIDSLNIGRNDIFARQPGVTNDAPVRRSLVDREIELLRTKLDAMEGFLPIRGASERAAVNDPYVAGLRAHLAHDPIARCGRSMRRWRSRSEPVERALCLNAHGVVLLGAGQLDAAQRDFTEASELAPSLPDPTLNLILAAARARAWRRALAIADAAAARLRDDDRLLVLKAKIWMARENPGEAAYALAPADDALLVGYRMLLDVVARTAAAPGPRRSRRTPPPKRTIRSCSSWRPTYRSPPATNARRCVAIGAGRGPDARALRPREGRRCVRASARPGVCARVPRARLRQALTTGSRARRGSRRTRRGSAALFGIETHERCVRLVEARARAMDRRGLAVEVRTLGDDRVDDEPLHGAGASAGARARAGPRGARRIPTSSRARRSRGPRARTGGRARRPRPRA
jgi:hypothetical protein